MPSFLSPASYAGCQLFVDAVRRTGGLDSDKLREELLKLKTKTVFGDFAVDERGFQVGHKAITVQWQDGKQVVVWPDEVATGKPRFPTPSWSQREKKVLPVDPATQVRRGAIPILAECM